MKRSTRKTAARVVLLGLLLACLGGCTRAYYRRQADQEVYGLVHCAAEERWPVTDYTIAVPCESRMFDPFNPDRPPMPPDDPVSHRLMHCVDGKHGWRCWHRNGDTDEVENPNWRQFLPMDEFQAVILDRETAVSLALLHSREYQTELEDLYLTALDVTFQRFRFDVQFYGGMGTTYTSQGRLNSSAGGQSQSTLEVGRSSPDRSLEATRLMATGGELLVGVANSLVWQFSGPDQYTSLSLLDFSLIQPLLRAGGRAVVLEQLTESERTMLANIRQMERYRRSFYVQTMIGRAVGPGPDRGGLDLAVLAPTVASTAPTSAGQGSTAGGILGILAEQQAIINQQTNVNALRNAVTQLEMIYEAGRIERHQVEFTRQSLLNAETRMVGLQKSHQDRIDAYKVTLGLPPDLPVKVTDPLLKKFRMLDLEISDALAEFADLLAELRNRTIPSDETHFTVWLDALDALQQKSARGAVSLQQDLETLRQRLPARREGLRRLADCEELKRREVEPYILDVAVLDARAQATQESAEQLAADLTAAMEALAKTIDRVRREGGEPNAKKREALRQDLLEETEDVVTRLRDLSLAQARARLDAIVLTPIELDSDEALSIARANRLDWMNARAILVDQWRQIEVLANALKSVLDLRVSGNLSSTGNDPLKFTSTTGQLRVGAQFDAPLTRLAERNQYREALIDYQRSRRAYYGMEDRVNLSLRNTLRSIRLDQLNFEIRRAAMALAILQTDLTRYRLERPPKPSEQLQLSPTLANDLVNALTQLLNSQNDILSVWVDYESQRMNLDLELGTMQLDGRGQWIDPGPIQPGFAPTGQLEEIPAPPENE